MGRRNALYRIMATTDPELGPESTGRAGGWASHDSLTISEGGGTEGPKSLGTMLQMETDWLLPFKTEG